MKLRIFFIISICVAVFLSAKAQDSTAKIKPIESGKKITEFHFAVANVNPVNIQIKYKEQIKKKLFFKAGLINLSYSESSHYGIGGIRGRSIENSLGIELGLEFRSNLNEHFCFYHGPNINATYKYYRSTNYNPNATSKQENLTFSVPFTLGMLMNLKNHFYLAAEINPAVSYTVRNGNTYNNSLNVGFSNGFALIALAYRL